jgi:hypothetical protein
MNAVHGPGRVVQIWRYHQRQQFHRLYKTTLTAIARSSSFLTMSIPPSLNPALPTSYATWKQGNIFSVFKASERKSNWLVSSLTTAKASTAGAECILFPCVKVVFEMVVVILETVEVQHLRIFELLAHIASQKLKNRDGLKKLCDDILIIVRKIINIVQYYQLERVSHGDTAAVKFEELCEDLEGYDSQLFPLDCIVLM